MLDLGTQTVALHDKNTSPSRSTLRLEDLKKAFPKMHIEHSLVITTTDPLEAVANTTQHAKDLEMSLQGLCVRRFRQADPVVNLRLQCDDANSVEALVNHVRDQQCVSQVMIEHLLKERPKS